MKSLLVLISFLVFFVCIGYGQRGDGRQIELKALDETEGWQYPYDISTKKRHKLLDVTKDFKDPVDVGDLFDKLGQPDRIDDMGKDSKPLSAFESGFMDANKGIYSFRCVWFARKASSSPGLSDSWLAAYVDKDQKTVSVIHSNYLQTAESGIESGQRGDAATDPSTGLKILSKPSPRSTDLACNANFSGTVVLRVTFLASGQIGTVAVIKGAPYGLIDQAVNAVRLIKFKPAQIDGVPTTVTKQVEYSFASDHCSR